MTCAATAEHAGRDTAVTAVVAVRRRGPNHHLEPHIEQQRLPAKRRRKRRDRAAQLPVPSRRAGTPGHCVRAQPASHPGGCSRSQAATGLRRPWCPARPMLRGGPHRPVKVSFGGSSGACLDGEVPSSMAGLPRPLAVATLRGAPLTVCPAAWLGAGRSGGTTENLGSDTAHRGCHLATMRARLCRRRAAALPPAARPGHH